VISQRDTRAAPPGSQVGLRPPSPLSTARASVPALRASLINAPCGTRHAGAALWRRGDLTVPGGMADDQSRQPVRLVVAIPVRPFELRLAREPRSTDGATPVLLAQELSTTWRRRVPRPLAVTGLEGRCPGGIPGGGVARHLDLARRVDGLPHADARRTADRLGAPPGCPPLRLTRGGKRG
jgi:hypothetical protein